MKPRDLALIPAFAALIVVCAILPAIHLTGPVPITLQTFGVLLTGAVLGAKRGFLAVLLYLALGAAGLPVFADGKSGLAVLVGPTGGYLAGFAFAAALCGFLVERLAGRSGSARPPSSSPGCSPPRCSSTPWAWPVWCGAWTSGGRRPGGSTACSGSATC